jgi:hypothetical protein
MSSADGHRNSKLFYGLSCRTVKLTSRIGCPGNEEVVHAATKKMRGG